MSAADAGGPARAQLGEELQEHRSTSRGLRIIGTTPADDAASGTAAAAAASGIVRRRRRHLAVTLAGTVFEPRRRWSGTHSMVMITFLMRRCAFSHLGLK